MLTVSSGFLAAIAAPSRMTRARVRLEVLDTDAWLDNTKQASSQATISRLDQVSNRVREPTRAYATFEPDYWRLDGSFVLPPAPDELPDVEVGWWSGTLCDAEGVFNPPESVTLICGQAYNAAGLTITFDPAASEYAADFTVNVYDGSDNLIYQEAVTGNDKPVYMLARNLIGFRRVVLVISRWAHGHRRARLTEVDFGLVEDYGESKLVDLSLITEMDPTSSTLPIGELRFRLDNSDKRFNILNPEGLYYFLQRRQRVIAEFGVDVGGNVEYVPAGTYYLTDWKSDTGSLTASFAARDMMDLLAQGRYRRGKVGTISAYSLAVDILEDSGVSDFAIDETLQAVTLSSCVPIVSHRDALQLVSVASCAVVRVGVDNRLVLGRLVDCEPVSTIDMSNTYDAPQIKLDKLITAVNVEIIGHRVRGSASVYSGTVVLDGQTEIWVEYSTPCQGHQVTISSGMLEIAEHFAYASRLVINGTGSVQVDITAEELEQVRSMYTLEDSSRPTGEQPQTLQVRNPLISLPEAASVVATWLLSEARKRLLYAVDWRQNPALECGDTVTVEDEFQENRPVRVTRQEYSYSGYISGKTLAKGGGSS